ncbi:MAG: AAA family ATPase [Merdibacter sp.]
MKISRLRLVHYRNYTDETVEFGDGIQLICGKNAQGKTNLLEAIYYCSTMRSHRTCRISI